ncbi:acetyl-CoA hydrolase/transferase C-terminal domain-containing protein [Mycolicibacterium peregrinum]|uniref:Acetyl-CoA hydrolase n=1 Tax=Mycolicibacterium peregrinum TaxID=43304 RepID=A0A4Z0HT51_MYCPR|nr:acetyl-CoA hydrolase/transferase C-terminal domain-containing protein [Mycolicibacterium peregrinum]TGB45502.1 acetyl-CoA hydrolase [Mycolicibacterium peregrinum]TGB47768.1 acetyl-CoA hydrolase [Mycolicibacterium peregrinum]
MRAHSTNPTTTASDTEGALRRIIKPGTTVALGDGVGALRTNAEGAAICRMLGNVARDVGGVRLILGWVPQAPLDLNPADFADVVVLMPGWGARSVLGDDRARFLPVSLSAMPALLAEVLRPNLLITRLVERAGLLYFGTEVSWQRGLMDAGVPVLALVDDAGPMASAETPVVPAMVTVVGRTGEGPAIVPQREPDAVHDELADQVLRFVPEGARLQYGPGQLGAALMRRCAVPIRLDTGLLTDAVVELDRRGKLLGVPSATYLIGSEVLYEWAEGRPILRGIDYSHDLTRLSRGEPFIAVNTAIEIDRYGQVNVEGVSDRVVGGIGGHPDFCCAGRSSPGGLSIIAVESRFKGRSPFVDRLSRPASTPAHDVDIVVTERGYADLRDCDWDRRGTLLAGLFD